MELVALELEPVELGELELEELEELGELEALEELELEELEELVWELAVLLFHIPELLDCGYKNDAHDDVYDAALDNHRAAMVKNTSKAHLVNSIL